MDLIPSERAVLNIIRMLVTEASSRTHRVTVLRSRWPALHSAAYDGGYGSLISKGLIALYHSRIKYPEPGERGLAS